ncbi:hypothetical protein P7K49_005983, partial [Saguinus oedipus]
SESLGRNPEARDACVASLTRPVASPAQPAVGRPGLWEARCKNPRNDDCFSLSAAEPDHTSSRSVPPSAKGRTGLGTSLHPPSGGEIMGSSIRLVSSPNIMGNRWFPGAQVREHVATVARLSCPWVPVGKRGSLRKTILLLLEASMCQLPAGPPQKPSKGNDISTVDQEAASGREDTATLAPGFGAQHALL